MITQPYPNAMPRGADCTRPFSALCERVLLCLVFAVLAQGCSWGKQANQPTVIETAEKTGNWICEAGKAADDWDCIQSEDIAAQTRALEARSNVDQSPLNSRRIESVEGTVDTTIEQQLPSTPQPIIDPDAAARPQPQPESRPTTESPQLTTARVERPTEPGYAKLAYRPEQPIRIIDLPENFYAAQLLAVSTKKQIEDFVVAHNLYNMSAARIEQNGQMLYVLLLGVYESKQIAESAIAVMPLEVQRMKPWVRPIDGLQDAMLRGDQLAAMAGIQ